MEIEGWRHEIDARSVARNMPIFDHDGPGDVARDDCALVLGEQTGVPLVRQDREERLLVRNLAP